MATVSRNNDPLARNSQKKPKIDEIAAVIEAVGVRIPVQYSKVYRGNFLGFKSKVKKITSVWALPQSAQFGHFSICSVWALAQSAQFGGRLITGGLGTRGVWLNSASRGLSGLASDLAE